MDIRLTVKKELLAQRQIQLEGKWFNLELDRIAIAACDSENPALAEIVKRQADIDKAYEALPTE